MRAWSLLFVLLVGTGCGDDDTRTDGGARDAEADDAALDEDARADDDDATTAAPDASFPPTPRELADEDALATLATWSDLPVPRDGHYRQQSSRDRESGEPAPLPLLDRGNRDLDNFVCASADADVRSLLVDAVLDLPSCPEPWVHGVVIARFEGSGRLARIWMTMLSARTGTLDREILRIYVDDAREPVLETPLADVIDGSADEIFAPPFGAGARSYVTWHYPVVFASRIVVAIDRLGPLDAYYHQTSVVLDEPTRTRAAAPDRLTAFRDQARAALEGRDLPEGEATESAVTLEPGETAQALDLTGPATLGRVALVVNEAELDALADVDLEVRWDGAEPAIAVPLLELFGAALDVPPDGGLALGGSRDGAGGVELWLRLPMPFESSASFTLVSHSASRVAPLLRVRSTPGVPAGGWGHLHVERHETVAPATAPAHPLASVRGAGRLAGVCLAMEGHGLPDDSLALPHNFLEGDERAFADGELVLDGTGTEDYFDDAFYFEDGPKVTPFAAAWGVSADALSGIGRASACRWHVLGDEIDFRRALDVEIEIGPGEPAVLDRYRSVAFVYVVP